MNTFDDRKKAAEAKFKHDQEFQFKVIARRNKLLGLWAAEKMGIAGDDAEAYAKQVVMADFEEPGDDDVVRKVRGDLTGRASRRTITSSAPRWSACSTRPRPRSAPSSAALPPFSRTRERR